MTTLVLILSLAMCMRGASFIGQRPKRSPARQRRAMDPSMPRTGATPVITAATKATTYITLTFNQGVNLTGIPQYELVGGTHAGTFPTSAVLLSPSSVKLGFADTVDATSFTIPPNDASITTRTGGVVQQPSFPVT